MTRGTTRLAAALAALLGLGVCASARAQAPGDASASTAAAARNLYEDGIEAASAERLDDAIEAFERSYELAPRAATLMNLGAVQERAGRFVAALGSYRRFLATADERLIASHGATAREAVTRLENLLAHLTVTAMGLEPGDEVHLDGAVLERASLGLDLPVDPGEHTLTIERAAPGPTSTPRDGDPDADTDGGDPDTIECARMIVTLTPGTRRDAELGARCPAAAFTVTATPGSSATEDPTPWIAVGVGGGLAIVGVIVVVVVLTAGAPSPEPPFVGNVGAGAFLVR